MPAAATSGGGFARRLSLLLTTAGLILAVVSVVRLFAVIAGTPQAQWLVEDPRLVDEQAVDPEAEARAAAVSRFVSDARLDAAALAACASPERVRSPATNAECLRQVDTTLRASPSSGELWLYRAQLLLETGNLGAAFTDSLRNSYRVAPREGWLAAGRVVLGLRVFPLLPAELQAEVHSDLDMVLAYTPLMKLLVGTYRTDVTFRQTAGAVIRGLPPAQIEEFVRCVREAEGG